MTTIVPWIILALTTGTGGFSGTVFDQDNQPVSGAVVSIYTGRPKAGPATLCPSCYPDCAKHYVTQSDGRFSFHDISHELDFRLVAGAQDHVGHVSEYLDPQSKELVTMRLDAIREIDLERTVSGRIVDQHGKPISAAHVSVSMVQIGKVHHGTVSKYISPITVTDAQGAFKLVANEPLDSVVIRAEAPGYAVMEDAWFRANKTPFSIALGPGACIQGRLVLEGIPLAKIRLGIVQKNRSLPNLVTPFEIDTDANGEFKFENLPPNTEYTLYTLTGQGAKGALPVSIIDVPGHAKLAQFGDIPTVEPRSLTIKVETSDGSIMPAKSTVYVGRDEAWRGAVLTLDASDKSTVTIDDLAPELYRLSFKIPGYQVERTEPHLQLNFNKSHMVLVDRNIEVKVVVGPDKSAKPKEP